MLNIPNEGGGGGGAVNAWGAIMGKTQIYRASSVLGVEQSYLNNRTIPSFMKMKGGYSLKEILNLGSQHPRGVNLTRGYVT